MGSTTEHKNADTSTPTVRNEELQSPPTKKARTTPTPILPSHPIMSDAEVAACFAPGLLESENVATLAAAYKTSSPYLHTVIPALVSPSLLRAVRNEVEQHLVFTEKETDIFKLLQTGDLANIDGLSSEEQQSLTHVHQLRNALYSSQFRAFVSAVTGCGALSGTKQDLSINSYCQGSHLLNHDDVIGTRCVSYILYVPDPIQWDPAYGGALELYPCVTKGTPDVIPTRVLPPQWNQFIMFAVQPGYSFHSVQEVVAPHDRLSISGWFHLPQEGEEGYVAKGNEVETAPASLAQLEESEEVFPFASIATDGEELTEEDCSYLSKYIHKDYLKLTSIKQITQRFVLDSFIQLKEFLTKEYADLLLLPSLVAADTRDELNDGKAQMIHRTGVHSGWIVQGSPVHQRFMTLPSSLPHDAVEEAKKLYELQELFTSASFHRWISGIIGSVLTHMRGRVRRFRPGLDYTLGTASKRSHSILDLTLTLTPDHACWEEGEYGGYECYIATDETNEDPAIYRSKPEAEEGEEEEDSTLLVTQASWNTLTMVLRDPNVMRFVKYVSARANGSRWDVEYEYLIQ